MGFINDVFIFYVEIFNFPIDRIYPRIISLYHKFIKISVYLNYSDRSPNNSFYSCVKCDSFSSPIRYSSIFFIRVSFEIDVWQHVIQNSTRYHYVSSLFLLLVAQYN